MDFVVEDGTGVAEAVSYITGEFVIEYAIATGATVPSGDPQAGAVAGSLWLDAEFGARYPGTRTHGRDQGLGWPRTDACDREGNEIADNVVPVEVMRAAAAAGLRAMTSPGSLSPDVTAGGALKRERSKVGSLEREREYAVAEGVRTPGPRFPEIDAILSGLIGSRGATVRLVRA